MLWSAALLLAGQGVWNLAPVLVTARLTDAATLAAGFTTVAVVVRAPVLLFPTIQAMLLPRLAGGARTPRPLVAAVVAAGLVWVALATARCRSSRPSSSPRPRRPPRGSWPCWRCRSRSARWPRSRRPSWWPPAAPHAAALAWLVGLVVLLAVGLAAAPPVPAATIGQLAAAGLVLGALVFAGRKP